VGRNISNNEGYKINNERNMSNSEGYKRYNEGYKRYNRYNKERNDPKNIELSMLYINYKISLQYISSIFIHYHR
jgi:hypothetical protein